MFKEKQYRGKHSKYPKVQSDVSDNDKLAIFTIAWGDPQANSIAIDTIKDYYLSASTDKEHTSPFPLSSNLSLPANNLKISMRLANEAVLKDLNNDEYMSCLEVMAVAISGREVNVAYNGGPSLLCKKRKKDLIPYIQQNQMGYEFAATQNYPLPKDFIGVDAKKEINLQSFRLSKNDQFYFVLADYLPMIELEDSLDIIEKKIKMSNERPYWIAEWSV